jgi:6,7-dimethyl-8-ribityllumazine synthase
LQQLSLIYNINEKLGVFNKIGGSNMVKIGAVVAEFNFDITQMMLDLAKEHAKFLDSEITEVITVPGVFDMPLAIKKLLLKDDIDAVVTLGAVIEGSTSHDEIVVQHASRKIADLALEYDKPVALGITGPGMTRLEAHQRVDYAKRAVEAAVKMCKRLE